METPADHNGTWSKFYTFRTIGMETQLMLHHHLYPHQTPNSTSGHQSMANQSTLKILGWVNYTDEKVNYKSIHSSIHPFIFASLVVCDHSEEIVSL